VIMMDLSGIVLSAIATHPWGVTVSRSWSRVMAAHFWTRALMIVSLTACRRGEIRANETPPPKSEPSSDKIVGAGTELCPVRDDSAGLRNPIATCEF